MILIIAAQRQCWFEEPVRGPHHDARLAAAGFQATRTGATGSHQPEVRPQSARGAVPEGGQDRRAQHRGGGDQAGLQTARALHTPGLGGRVEVLIAMRLPRGM